MGKSQKHKTKGGKGQRCAIGLIGYKSHLLCAGVLPGFGFAVTVFATKQQARALILAHRVLQVAAPP